DGHHAVRLGLTSVQGIGTADAERIVAARTERPFADMADVVRRCGLTRAQQEQLATAGAFDEFGLSRRQALWNAGYSDGQDRLPGTAIVAPPPMLPGMSDVELTLADLESTRISPSEHPFEHLRPMLTGQGILSVEALWRHEPDRRVRVAGLITHRQRPYTAGGVTFLNLEDETGMLNVVVFDAVWQRHRIAARSSAAVVVRGRLEHQQGAVNLVAEVIERLDGAAVPRGHRSRDFR
ncbi:OB-fold nucleic acid binding domain-containing protein, partial [Aeromicrobium sp.]|uniref:helix-hairpin-helix domain-containing protein n=1 Tax=Aeromicrobium sp. TaxID=1871063 RepID=UPI0028B0CB36